MATNRIGFSSDFVLVNSNVGVGTTAPLQKLHVLGNLLVAAGSSTGQHITQKAYELNSGTLSWEGSAGQLFSIVNNLSTGSIFSVNDVSGIPSIDVNADGTIILASYSGNVGVGTTLPTSKLSVTGDGRFSGIVTASQLDLTASSSANDSVLYLSGTPTSASGTNGLLGVGALNFSDTDIIANFTHSVNSYAQLVVQNKNSGASSSADIIVNNDRSAGTTYYGDFGINGTTFSGGGVFGDVDGTYLYSAGGTLSLGSLNSYDVKIATNNIERVRINATGVGIGTTNPVGQLQVSSGPVIIGAATSTGTASQPLQVTGGAYVSGNLGIGTTNPQGILHTVPSSTLSTTGVPYGFSIQNSSTKTYPTSASFNAYPGFYQNLELGTAQTVNATTPSGFNFTFGIYNNLTKSAGNTSDIERLYFGGFYQNFNWTDANTCKQYVSFSDAFSYQGIDANGRISSALNATSLVLYPPTGGTQTIGNATGKSDITYNGNGTSTINVTNSINAQSNLSLYSFSAGTKTYNITNHSFFSTSSFWGSTQSAGTIAATITNLYGLKLSPPSSTTGLTVTNNWGVYQEWSNSQNYFAGNVLVGSTTPTGTASQPLQVTGGAYVSGNLGVGATAPSFKADIAGDARVTSTNKMRFGGTAGTTNFYIQYNSTANSLDFVAG